MKTIIATIKPHHLLHIRNGVKTAELRKTRPQCPTPFRVLLCESGTHGRISLEFICDCITEAKQDDALVATQTYLTREAVSYYLGGEAGYLWHITNVIDYCSAKEYHVRNISEFGLKRPPQSWCYVKEG